MRVARHRVGHGGVRIAAVDVLQPHDADDGAADIVAGTVTCLILMALLFVGGVMNLAWVAAISTFVLLEKVVPRGLWIGRGAAMILGLTS